MSGGDVWGGKVLTCRAHRSHFEALFVEDSCLPVWAVLCVHLPPTMSTFPWEHGVREAQADAVSASVVPAGI